MASAQVTAVNTKPPPPVFPNNDHTGKLGAQEGEEPGRDPWVM